MKKIKILLSLTLILTFLTSCQYKKYFDRHSEDRFDSLITYCQKNAQTLSNISGTYYKLAWSDVDSSETGTVNFTVCIYENRKISVTGKSVFLYNSGIENEVVYTVSFIYENYTNTKIDYQVEFVMKMTRLKDAYNYYPYTLDEVRMSDNNAVFDTEKWSASCYYESYYSTNNLINFDDRNDTLRSVSVDSFSQLKKYFNDRANISLFEK